MRSLSVLLRGSVLVALLAPAAATVLVDGPPWRDALVETAVCGGYVALTLVATQFATTGRFRDAAGRPGVDSALRAHRRCGFAAAALVLGHVAALTVADADYVAFLDPRVDLRRASVLWIALGALAAVVVRPLLRRRFRFDYGRWRLFHGLAAVALLWCGVEHALDVSYRTNAEWKWNLWRAVAAAATAAFVVVRVVRPLRQLARPWRVAAVRREGERVWTVELEAVGHAGLRFRPGQFAWATFGRSPFGLEQHAFSLASNADAPARISFAIKELGDYTRHIGELAIGGRAYVDGPYGAFDVPADPAVPLVLLAGGIGVAPFLSMLRTLVARGEPRNVLLIYGAGRPATLAFDDELTAALARLGGRYVPVLEDGPPDRKGERGVVDAATVARHVPPESRTRARYFACGPDPMLRRLVREFGAAGLPPERLQAERFDLF